MSYPYRPLTPLAAIAPQNRLFQDWCSTGLVGLRETDTAVSATAAVRSALAVPTPHAIAPLFRDEAWVSSRATLDQGATPTPDQSRWADNLARLTAGEAATVVTGQQTGFMGGPLLTWYKAATAVALARLRSEAGRPTVPVFWCADDDDDLAEALAPVGWDPAARELLRAGGRARRRPAGGRHDMTGPTPASRWCAGAADWLHAQAARAPEALATDLAQMWRTAVEADWTWSRLHLCAMLRLLVDQGLVVVRGNDPRLHAAAAPLYKQILDQLGSLADAARARGADLTARGWHAQIGERSLARPLFVAEAERRRPWLPTDPPVTPERWRPGVMLRSLVQDWLLAPAAVVVGPGELAYLRQLDPLYAALGVERSPLVPRLFAWLAPAGLDVGTLAAPAAPGTPAGSDLERLAEAASEHARDHLERLLGEDLGLPAGRARGLAAGRARRWRKGVAAMLRHESARQRRESRPREPAWVFPEGQRQERKLAAVAAGALWGDELGGTILAAAAAHLRAGAGGDWREYLLEVPDLSVGRRSEA